MTETTWGDEGAAPRKKRIPTWLWFCGGGCLIAAILAVVAAGFAFQQIKKWGDPELQLPALAEALPFDELPSDLKFLFAFHIKIDGYVFTDAHGHAAIFWVAGAGDEEEMRRTMLNPEFSGGLAGMGDRKNLEPVEVRVQGRDLSGVRFFQQRGSGAGGNQSGHSVLLDVTPEGKAGLVALQLVREGGRSADQPISNEEIVEFLKPFHVGSER